MHYHPVPQAGECLIELPGFGSFLLCNLHLPVVHKPPRGWTLRVSGQPHLVPEIIAFAFLMLRCSVWDTVRASHLWGTLCLLLMFFHLRLWLSHVRKRPGSPLCPGPYTGMFLLHVSIGLTPLPVSCLYFHATFSYLKLLSPQYSHPPLTLPFIHSWSSLTLGLINLFIFILLKRTWAPGGQGLFILLFKFSFYTDLILFVIDMYAQHIELYLAHPTQ